jgi:squalene synthase HpnD
LRCVDQPAPARAIDTPERQGGVSMTLHANATAKPAAPAAGSSFYMAMRILPPAQRAAMFEVYAFCRAVDDIADDTLGSRAPRLEQLACWRSDIGRLFAGEVGPAVAGLAGPVETFGLAEADFLAVIDGMEMDVVSDIRAPDWATLDLYCDRVASAVGRLSVRVFGVEPSEGPPLAHHLGRALQLTNILRDIDEDATLGRLYLPREALLVAGIAATEPAALLDDPRLGKACIEVAARARGHFAAAAEIMARCPRSVVRAPRLMAAAYRLILDRLEAQGWSPPRKRVRVPRLRLLLAALRVSLS